MFEEYENVHKNDETAQPSGDIKKRLFKACLLLLAIYLLFNFLSG